MSDKTTKPEEQEEQGFMSHLFELRDRLMRMMLSILLIFLGLFYWANEIYTYLAQPLIKHLPEGSSMIAIDVASPFLTPFKLVLMLSIFLAMPVILYQLWAFIAPGLYKNEKRLAVPLLISSVLLFYFGIAFAYYVVFPLIFGFFTSIGPDSVAITTDIGRYLDFVLSIFFGFGLAFEVPIATIIVIALGMTTPDKLATKRPYVIVAAFIIGMLLTPPDVISQLLLAIPMWLLFEAGLIAARFLLPKKEESEEEDDDPDPDEEDSVEDKQPTKNEQKETTTVASSAIGGSAFSDEFEVIDDPAADTQHNDTENYPYDEEDDFVELTEEEMDAELDRIEAEEDEDEDEEVDDPYAAESYEEDQESDSKVEEIDPYAGESYEEEIFEREQKEAAEKEAEKKAKEAELAQSQQEKSDEKKD